MVEHKKNFTLVNSGLEEYQDFEGINFGVTSKNNQSMVHPKGPYNQDTFSSFCSGRGGVTSEGEIEIRSQAIDVRSQAISRASSRYIRVK